MQNLDRKRLDGTVRDGDTSFDLPVNMRPVKVPYSRTRRPVNHFWETRPGISYKNITLAPGSASLAGGKITDIIEIDNIMYFMWISNADDSIRIFQSTDWGCTLTQIVNKPFDAAYAGQVRKFTVIDFVRGKPRKVYKIWGVEQPTRQGIFGVQQNNNYNGISTGYFKNDVVGSDFNKWAWADQIKVGDYIYAYSGWYPSVPTCDDTTTLTGGYCGQVRQITCDVVADADRLGVDNAWSGFDGWLMNGVTVVRAPQTIGENMWFYIFPEVGATFIYPASGGAYAFHYYDAGTDTTLSTLYCNFTTANGGFTDILAYDGSFGRINVFFDQTTNAIVYSQPNLGGAYISDYYPVDPDINGITSFQKYIIYFWPNSIGAMYINEDTNAQGNITGYSARGKTVRKNLGAWTNRNWTSDTFDEYDDGFYFLGSNKQIYWLSIVFNDWELTSKIESIHDTRGREIYGELQALQEGDNVFIRGNNDSFTVYINHLSGGTKMLKYWKKQKKWSIDVMCCGVITEHKFDVLLGDAIYHYCGDVDCNSDPVKSKIQWRFGEAWEGITPMTYYSIWPLILQLGDATIPQWGLKLNVYSYRNTYKPVLTLDLDDLPYALLQASIESGATTTPPVCPASKLQPCEWWDDACLGNLPSVVQKTPCSCESRPDDANYCECYENKAYFLWEFANILAELSLTGSLFRFELVSSWAFSFWGYTMWFNIDGKYKNWFHQGEIVRCKNC